MSYHAIRTLFAATLATLPRVTIKEDEIPVFWACGVTANMAIQNANLEFVLTQEPNHVFISDIREEDVGFLNTPAIA